MVPPLSTATFELKFCRNILGVAFLEKRNLSRLELCGSHLISSSPLLFSSPLFSSLLLSPPLLLLVLIFIPGKQRGQHAKHHQSPDRPPTHLLHSLEYSSSRGPRVRFFFSKIIFWRVKAVSRLSIIFFRFFSFFFLPDVPR